MPSQLSGGQRQRVAIARALIHEPTCILADEPTAAADRHTAVDIVRLLRTLSQQRQATVILVSHDTELASTVTDRIIHFKMTRVSDGSLAALQTP